MTVFVILAAISMMAQAAVLIASYIGAKKAQQRLALMLPEVEKLVATSQLTMEQSRVQMLDITNRTVEILETTRRQMVKVDEVLTDATGRALVQLEKAELVLDDTLSRAHETVAVVHTGIMKPLRELQGIAAGVRTAFTFLLRTRRTSGREITQDEEMFI